MSLLWITAAMCAFLLLTSGCTENVNQPSHSVPSLSPRELSCPGIEGNSDFYGLGIRIGVYLQWFSSWISNTVEPSKAASNHDANTIFLTAILIATTVALAGDNIQLVEVYIMLLLSSGFVFTVLSFLGLRLYLLQPSSTRLLRVNLSTTIKYLDTIEDDLRAAMVDTITSSTPSTKRRLMQVLRRITRLLSSARMTFGFKSVSELKHPALSWVGIIARCVTGAFLATLTILTWWREPQQTLPDDSGPCTPTFFFFGLRKDTGSMLWFFRIAAILLAVSVGYILSFFYVVVSKTCRLGYEWHLRHGFITMVETIKPGVWDSLSDEEKELLRAILSSDLRMLVNQDLDITMKFRALRQISRSMGRIDRVTLNAPLGAGDGDLNSSGARSHHISSPHGTCGSHHGSTLADAVHDANSVGAAVHTADAQAMMESVHVTDSQQMRHSSNSGLHYTGISGQNRDKSSWQIKASELPRFSVLLQSFMSLFARGIETGKGLEVTGVEPRRDHPSASM